MEEEECTMRLILRLFLRYSLWISVQIMIHRILVLLDEVTWEVSQKTMTSISQCHFFLTILCIFEVVFIMFDLDFIKSIYWIGRLLFCIPIAAGLFVCILMYFDFNIIIQLGSYTWLTLIAKKTRFLMYIPRIMIVIYFIFKYESISCK